MSARAKALLASPPHDEVPRRDMAVLGSMGRPGLAGLYTSLAPTPPRPWTAPRTRWGWAALRVGVFLWFATRTMIVGGGFYLLLVLSLAFNFEGFGIALLENMFAPWLIVVGIVAVCVGLFQASLSQPTIESSTPAPQFQLLLLVGRLRRNNTPTIPEEPVGALAHLVTEEPGTSRRVEVDVTHAFDLHADGSLTSRPGLRGVQELVTDAAGAKCGEDGERIVLVCTRGRHGLHLAGRLKRWAQTDWHALEPGPTTQPASWVRDG